MYVALYPQVAVTTPADAVTTWRTPLKISIRLPLLPNSSVVNVRVPAIGKTFYSWDHLERKFVLNHRSVPIKKEDVLKSAQSMRVEVEGEADAVLSPLVPPQKPLELAVWEYGFIKAKRKNDFEAARIAAHAIKQRDEAGHYRVIMHNRYVFVFEPPPVPHAELIPVFWSVAQGVGACDVRSVLHEHCSFQR